MSNKATCHQCLVRHGRLPAPGQPVVCVRDGEPIDAHAAAGECPDNLFAPLTVSARPKAPSIGVIPVPFEAWPAWAKTVALVRRRRHVGVGDTFRMLARLAVVGASKELLERAIGAYLRRRGMLARGEAFALPCGCADRRDHWNAVYPYPGNE